jgi:hypothetical protein
MVGSPLVGLLQASPAPNSLKLNPKADWLAHSHA